MNATVDTTRYRMENGRGPGFKTFGTWAFTFDRPTYRDVSECLFVTATFAAACRAARDEAKLRRASTAYLQS